MPNTLRNAAYVSVIAASAVLIVAAVSSMVPVPQLQDESMFQYPFEIVESLRGEGAYAAMYERYPDAVELVDATPHNVMVEVGVVNSETGNQLILWLYADPYSSGYQMAATCRDHAGNVVGDDGSAGLFSAEFIRTTDCVSPA